MATIECNAHDLVSSPTPVLVGETQKERGERKTFENSFEDLPSPSPTIRILVKEKIIGAEGTSHARGEESFKIQRMAGDAFYICTSISDCMLNHFSYVQLFVTLWTGAHQAPLSMGFSRQEYWSGLPFSPAGDLPDSEIEPMSHTCPALAGRFFTTSTMWE